MVGTGAQASEERLGVQGLFSLMKTEFGDVRSAPHICEDVIKMAKPDSSQWCMVGRQQHKFKQERFRLGIRKAFFPQWPISRGSRLPTEAGQSPRLEVFKSRLDKTLNSCI